MWIAAALNPPSPRCDDDIGTVWVQHGQVSDNVPNQIVLQCYVARQIFQRTQIAFLLVVHPVVHERLGSAMPLRHSVQLPSPLRFGV